MICRCRHDVSDPLCSALERAAAADPVDFKTDAASDGRAADRARYVDVLATAPVTKVWGGPAFAFPTETPDQSPAGGVADGGVVLVTDVNVDVLRPLLPAWGPDVHQSPPLMALVVDGQAVAVCGSVRITASVHQAGVDTAAAFRGRGYAPRVVAARARTVRSLGAEPLYSTEWQNAGSRTVARKLGLVLYGTDLRID